MFATDVESTRYALGGRPGRALGRRRSRWSAPTAVAWRGCRRRPRPRTARSPRPGSPVVPVKALKLIERNLDDDDPPVHLAIQSGTAVLVRTERAIIYSRLVEGRFPRYQDVFPSSVEVKIPMEVGPLRLVVEQASIVTSEESRGVDFRFADGLLRLSSQAADVGRSHVELPIAYEGKDVEITFDPRYLTDALKTLDEQASDHRRADRPQERRRLQDRGRLHLRGHAPDPRPLTCERGHPDGRPGRRRRPGRSSGDSEVWCFVATRRRPVAMRGTFGYNESAFIPVGAAERRARPSGAGRSACRARNAAERGRCPISWASCSPRRGYGRLRGLKELEDAWNAAVGEPQCHQTRVGEVRRGVLNVTVAHSTLLEELAAYRKPALLAALRRDASGTSDPRHPVPRRPDRPPRSSAAPTDDAKARRRPRDRS